MNDPHTVDAIIARYQSYADTWRAKGRVKEAEALEDVIARLKDGRATDPRTVPTRTETRHGERLPAGAR